MNPNKEVMVGAAAVILLAGIFWVMAYADIDWLRILVLFSLAGIAAQVFGKDLNTERIISFTVASRHLKYLAWFILEPKYVNN